MKKIIGILLIISMVVFGGPGFNYARNNDELRMQEELRGKGAGYVPDEIIVKFRDDDKAFRVIKVGKGLVNQKVREYRGKSNVVYAEPNYIASAYNYPVNDSYYSYQWNFRGRDEGGVNAQLAWDISNGSGTIVAVLDTGIAYTDFRNYDIAPDLAGTLFVKGYDFINGDSKPNDDNGHGTHVAGTIAQTTNNNLGVAGIAYGAELMPVKVLNSQGSGSYSTIAEGIYFAANNGADVINMSLGGPVPSQTLENALAYAYGMGVTIVAATGNDNGDVGYPAAYDDYVIAVGATDYEMNRSYYSNFGSQVDLVAPGGDVTVDLNYDGYGDGILQNTFGNSVSDFGYYFYQGTSMATPHVAAAAAILKSNDDTLTAASIRMALEGSAHDLGDPGWDQYYGYGIIDIYAALSWTPGPVIENDPPTADPKSVTTDEEVLVNIVLSGSDPDDDEITFSIVREPSNGTLTGSGVNYSYTGNVDFNGSDSFEYVANDGYVNSTPATVSITVDPVNDPPEAYPAFDETVVNTPVTIQLLAYDVDGDGLTYSGPSTSTSGTITFDGSEYVIYEPDQGFIGQDTFTYRVFDGEYYSDYAIVTVTVNEETVPSVVTYDDYDGDTLTTNVSRAGRNYFVTASVVITVYQDGNRVGDALVSGQWDGTVTAEGSGTSNGNGDATINLEKTKVSTSSPVLTFTVKSITINGETHFFNQD